jgi:pimeloyl-ACP methyl ester carboxylesterase
MGLGMIEVDGLNVAYQRRGEGPLLLLLPGFVGDSREWAAEIDGLSDLSTVVAWDTPGSGRSADPPESFREAPDRFNAEVRKFLAGRG